ncbi:MAG: FISUMP domain-containing protein [Bacteroidales bacterium]
MSFKCKIGLHTWDGCKCSLCGKARDKGHDLAADCARCSRCGKVFDDESHDWSQDCEKCARCGKTRENHHSWENDCEKCSKCGKIRSNGHRMKDGVCQICGRGSFIDGDGSTHNIIKIGDHVILAENLSKKPPKGKSWVYDDKEVNKSVYGCLYDWEAARSLSIPGWHLPTKAEWESLHAFLGGDDKKVYLELKAGGKTGFSSLFGGERYARGAYNSLGASAHYWSDTAEDEKQVWQFKLGAYTETAGLEKADPNFGFSVRLFRNK